MKICGDFITWNQSRLFGYGFHDESSFLVYFFIVNTLFIAAAMHVKIILVMFDSTSTLKSIICSWVDFTSQEIILYTDLCLGDEAFKSIVTFIYSMTNFEYLKTSNKMC